MRGAFVVAGFSEFSRRRHRRQGLRGAAGHTYRLLADGASKAVGLIPQFGRPDLLLYSSINPRFSNKSIDYAKSRSLDGAAK